MTGLERIRRRVPLVVFVILFVVAVLAVGFACACLSGNSTQAAERAVNSAFATAAVIEVWSLLAVVTALVALTPGRLVAATGRASPVVTQRFLF